MALKATAIENSGQGIPTIAGCLKTRLHWPLAASFLWLEGDIIIC